MDPSVFETEEDLEKVIFVDVAEEAFSFLEVGDIPNAALAIMPALSYCHRTKKDMPDEIEKACAAITVANLWREA